MQKIYFFLCACLSMFTYQPYILAMKESVPERKKAEESDFKFDSPVPSQEVKSSLFIERTAGYVPVKGTEIQFATEKFNVKIPVFSDDPKKYAYDISEQHKDLVDYWNCNSENAYKQYTQNTIELFTYSLDKTFSPRPTVLFLHGSGGPDNDFDLVLSIVKQNMNYVSWPRFKFEKVPGSQGQNSFHIESCETSYADQAQSPLAYEIIKIHHVCQILVERGIKDIILMGHSLGGVLTLQCALEQNADMFRNITSKQKTGSVKGYIALSGLPVAMRPLTSSEPVHLIHGIHDTYCNYSVVKNYYDTFCKNKKNIIMHEEQCGHDVICPQYPRTLKSLWNMMKTVFASQHKNWKTKLKNVYEVACQYFRGETVSITTFEKFQDFNDTCVFIDKEKCIPLKEGKQPFALDALPEYIKSNVNPYVKDTFVMQETRVAQARIRKITSIIRDNVSQENNR